MIQERTQPASVPSKLYGPPRQYLLAVPYVGAKALSSTTYEKNVALFAEGGGCSNILVTRLTVTTACAYANPVTAQDDAAALSVMVRADVHQFFILEPWTVFWQIGTTSRSATGHPPSAGDWGRRGGLPTLSLVDGATEGLSRRAIHLVLNPPKATTTLSDATASTSDRKISNTEKDGRPPPVYGGSPPVGSLSAMRFPPSEWRKLEIWKLSLSVKRHLGSKTPPGGRGQRDKIDTSRMGMRPSLNYSLRVPNPMQLDVTSSPHTFPNPPPPSSSNMKFSTLILAALALATMTVSASPATHRPSHGPIHKRDPKGPSHGPIHKRDPKGPSHGPIH
ncbi:hypothetical protein BDK51DRAFT_44009 [Blyttiomyces helicus]|uniref:Uncharacterized protein n=1 Tax=Blyttiomyces helicus TaxID=388810 RepID=A0A4P9VZ66_9FUNG|nr:hypothetical protein BDK51DRAFT_44009 [Blyttiomyces helicus]|eukprot:RKO85099.1 hypothetical protein BDK51DRAFT_44009 [Blyttiomyces helicus]